MKRLLLHLNGFTLAFFDLFGCNLTLEMRRYTRLGLAGDRSDYARFIQLFDASGNNGGSLGQCFLVPAFQLHLASTFSFYHTPLSLFCSSLCQGCVQAVASFLSLSNLPTLVWPLPAVWAEKNVPRLSLKLSSVASRIFAPLSP
jgi:hypothetical protein